MAKTFTNDEKREIEEKAKYILTAMDDIGKNGDAYCTDEQLFRASKAVRPSLTGQRYRTDKAASAAGRVSPSGGVSSVCQTDVGL